MQRCVNCECLTMYFCQECYVSLCSECGTLCPVCMAVLVFHRRRQMGYRMMSMGGIGELSVVTRPLNVYDPYQTEKITAELPC